MHNLLRTFTRNSAEFQKLRVKLRCNKFSGYEKLTETPHERKNYYNYKCQSKQIIFLLYYINHYRKRTRDIKSYSNREKIRFYMTVSVTITAPVFFV